MASNLDSIARKVALSLKAPGRKSGGYTNDLDIDRKEIALERVRNSKGMPSVHQCLE